MADIYYAGVNLSTRYHLAMDESQTFVSPEKDVEFISIPGRNGSITFDNHRFKEVVIPINCFIRDNFVDNYRALMQFLLSRDRYLTLRLPNDPDHFRQAYFKGGTEVQTGSFNKSGHFTLEFICKPERWRDDGGTIVTHSTSPFQITNPTQFSSKPVITVVGKGSLVVNGYPITIKDTYPYSSMDIDCDMMLCAYNQTTNVSAYAELPNGFPVLKPGDNTVTFSFTSQTHSVAIMPRWYDL